MSPLHAAAAPAPPLAHLPLALAPPVRSAPLPTLTRRGGASLTSALLLALLLLSVLLQASFFIGLASGRVAGPDASPARPAAAVR